jgi:hypothetical protein
MRNPYRSLFGDGSGGKYVTEDDYRESCARRELKEYIDEVKAEREYQQKRDEEVIERLK